jgi:ATP-binding cassette, subfamily C (CFTR/MRP), member 1
LIFKKSLELDAKEAKDNDAVTLMSTDIEGIASGIKDMHEIWASIIELAVPVYLLARQVGPACFLVIIPAVGKSSRPRCPRTAY